MFKADPVIAVKALKQVNELHACLLLNVVFTRVILTLYRLLQYNFIGVM